MVQDVSRNLALEFSYQIAHITFRMMLANPEFAQRLTYYDYYLLHMATIHQLPKFVEVVLEADKTVINQKDCRSNYSSDASHVSFSNNQFPHRFVKDATALHYACLSGNLEIIEILLKAGADWTLTDWKDRTPEQLIFDNHGDDTEVKDAYIKLRDEEEARRKARAEEEEARKKAEVEGEKQNEGEDSNEEEKDGDGDVKVADGEGEEEKKESDNKSEKNDIEPDSDSEEEDSKDPEKPTSA